MNKNVSLWRGDNAPSTNYHIWLKNDGKFYKYSNDSWKPITVNTEDVEKYIDQMLNNLSFDNYYTKEQIDNKNFITEKDLQNVLIWNDVY